jgi:hypothetical protein
LSVCLGFPKGGSLSNLTKTPPLSAVSLNKDLIHSNKEIENEKYLYH